MREPAMSRRLRLRSFFTAALGLAACSRTQAPDVEVIANVAQGTTYSIKWWSAAPIDASALERAIQDELGRIDALLSNYRDDSAVERFNAARTVEAQELPAELVRLLDVATTVHRGSAGCFDPTVRPLVKLWRVDRADPRIPGDAEVAAALARVGFDKLGVEGANVVRKAVPDLELDFASIGQGYTVERLAGIVEAFGIASYVVEIGGEIAARGARPDGTQWRVGIEEPFVDGGVRAVLRLPADARTAVVTSGTYRQFFVVGGRRYSHVVDPRTGRPVEHSLLSATVVDADATLAASWATAFVCLGPDAAIAAADAAGIAALLLVGNDLSIEERTSAAFSAHWSHAVEH
jgi:thiamine biosynthesis lipoprotein